MCIPRREELTDYKNIGEASAYSTHNNPSTSYFVNDKLAPPIRKSWPRNIYAKTGGIHQLRRYWQIILCYVGLNKKVLNNLWIFKSVDFVFLNNGKVG